MRHTAKIIAFGCICAGLALSQNTHTPPNPANMAQHQVQRLTQMLTLSSAQQAQATNIFTNALTANQSVQTSLRQAHASLLAAIKSNDSGSISTLSNQIGTLTAQSTATNASAEAAFYATLTPDQQAKYNPGPGGGPGFGGRGGGFPRGGPRQ